jgi:hypothetical protein
MKKGPFILVRVIGFLLVLGLIAGAGAVAYRAGMVQGITQAPAVAKAIEKAAENGQPVPQMMYDHNFGYGYYPMPLRGHHFGFNPLGAICGSLFLIFLVLGFFKMMFFRGMMWGHGPWAHGPHGSPWGTPPWMRSEPNEKKEGESVPESKEEK